MENKNKLFLILFISIILILILIVTLNSGKIDLFIRENIGIYGYPAIFLFCFLCDSIDQPILPEIPAVLGVFYGLKAPYVFLFAAIGISFMGLINFNIGRLVLSKRIVDLKTSKKYSKFYVLFHKYGRFSLLLAALTPLPYITFVWLSGAFGMKFRNFLIFGMIPKTLRLGFYLTLSYLIF